MSPPRNPAVTPRPTLHSVVSPLSIKGAWIIYIYMYAYSTESCIHLFRNQPASVQRQSPDKENQRFPLVFAGLFSWRGGGGDYSTRVERVDGCDWFIFNLFISNSKKDQVFVVNITGITSAVTWVVIEVALHCSAVHCIVHYWGSACMYLTF